MALKINIPSVEQLYLVKQIRVVLSKVRNRKP